MAEPKIFDTMNNQDTPETNAMASMRRTTKEWIDHSEKLERERNRLAAVHAAALKLKNAKGRHHSELTAKELFEMLP